MSIHDHMQEGPGRVQWENGNSFSRFPFADDCPLPEGFPLEAIVDTCVVSPRTIDGPDEKPIVLGCLYIGPAIASVMFYAGDTPILAARVLRSTFEPFSPVRMESLVPGYSGSLSFGDMEFGQPRMYRCRIPLADSVVLHPVVGRLHSFIDPSRGTTATGDVGLDIPASVTASLVEEGHQSTVRLVLSDEGRAELASECQGEDTARPVPIKTINGLAPDKDGRIAIVFARDPEEVPV